VRAGAGRRGAESTPTRRIVALVAGLALFVTSVVVLVQVLKTTPCDNVHFQSQTGVVQAPTQPPPIGETRIVHSLRQFVHGGSPAVFCDDFPDPFVLRVGTSYYAYSTNTSGFNVPVLSTHGLFSTGGRRDALPQLPAWSEPGWVWAPAVVAHGSGYLLYYSTRDRSSGQECLSVAASDNPTGPFVDGSPGPLVCPPTGAYDPSPVAGPSGQLVLLWSTGATIDGAPLNATGTAVAGSSTTVLVADQGWEGGIVEAPSLVFAGGRSYVFYSGGHWQTASYAIGYAVCGSALGPCAKAPGPWLASSLDVQGPGSPDFFTDPSGRLWMSLHAWVHGNIGYPNGARDLFVLPIGFVNGAPVPA
jgi:beta-xylosidase